MKSVCVALSAAVASCIGLQIPEAQAGNETVLYSFCSQLDGMTCLDGSSPYAGLTDVKGTLYGTTIDGGSYDGGTMFALDPTTGIETVIHSFGNGTDGLRPYGGLIQAKGIFYGSTSLGGADTGCSCGTVYAIDGTTGSESVLYSFAGGTDGANPDGALLDLKGTLYGTTESGGNSCYNDNCGTIYSLDPGTGGETVLYAFKGNPDGEAPLVGLTAVKGMLYGTTLNGYSTQEGIVFAVNPKSGAETIVHGFTGGSGRGLPRSKFDQSRRYPSRNHQEGGAYNQGTVFALNPPPAPRRSWYSFAGGTDGSDPVGGLIEAKGTLYGTTRTGGTTGCTQHLGCGTVYSLDPATGTERVLFSFRNGVDGAMPRAGVIYVKGTLLGTTTSGGANDGGRYLP